MERSGYIRPIQGGGSGSGFETPASILYTEPKVFGALARTITVRAMISEDKCKDDQMKTRAAAWKHALIRRLFKLHTLRKQPSSSGAESCSARENDQLQEDGTEMTPANEVQDKVRCTESQLGSIGSRLEAPRSSDIHSPTRSHVPSQHSLNSDVRTSSLEISEVQHSESNASCLRSIDTSEFTQKFPSLAATEKEAQNASCTITQFIPGIPTNIADVVQSWRSGCAISGGVPVMKFKTAEFRKGKIDKYSDSKWRKSGQRAAFQRLKRLMEIVASYADPAIPSIYDESIEDERWKLAVDKFQNCWAGVRLTLVLRRFQQKRS